MGDTQKETKEKVLTGILCGLVMVVIILVVVIIATKLRKREEITVDSNDCSVMEGEEQRKCLNKLYISEGSDGSQEMFDRSLNKAFDDGKNEQAMWLILDREDSLVFDENCEEMLKLVYDERMDRLPPDQFFYYSAYVIGDVVECGDMEKATQLREEYFALMNNGSLSRDLWEEDIAGEPSIEATNNSEVNESVDGMVDEGIVNE